MTDLLILRERRFLREQKLAQEGTVVTIKPNVPGADKRFVYSDYASYVLFCELTAHFAPVQTIAEHDWEGLVFTLLLQEAPETVKQACMQWEEDHPLGRLTDLDVSGKGRVYSRQDAGYPPRRCYICQKPAVVCSRSEAHSAAALRAHIKQTVLAYLNKRDETGRLLPGRCAEMALLSELCREYGFGCVTVHDSGSHTDMDFFTFLRHLPVMGQHLDEMVHADISDFSSLRAYGRRMEQAMLQATGGINTHKGAIFLYLLLAKAFGDCRSLPLLPARIRQIAAPVQADFSGSKDTAGLLLYEKYGITGIRGQALRGFPALFIARALPETPDAFLRLTLQLLQEIEDTNAIHRGGMTGWQTLKRKAKKAEGNEDRIRELDDWCKKQGISTGGTADLVGGTVFIHALDACERMWNK